MAKKRRSQEKRSRKPRTDGAARQAAPPTTGMPVVGLCSSAGGLDSLSRFFKAMPAESGMAFLVVPDLDPTHEGVMVELLAKQTTMPVLEAEDGAAPQPDHVYVIPPDKSLELAEGVLKLSGLPGKSGTGTVIDAFLRSLAHDRAERAVAVVLSGTGSHGSQGIKEIKLTGGVVIVQAPDSAEYAAMPQSAVATGVADFVLQPEAMPAVLVERVSHVHGGGSRAEPSEADAQRAVNGVLAILRARLKYDFGCYRRNMLLRRIRRRMALCQARDLKDYQQRLREDAAEVNALYKDLLIGVTAFFREPEAFRVLAQRVIPKLVGRASEESPLRVWVPACATGEEAYTVGMLLIEGFEAANRPASFQVFATDVDDESLEVARQGVYPDSIAHDVSPDRLRRFFTRSGRHGYQVGKQLRDSIVVARQSLISDAPFSRIDLISCRNFLIYLKPEFQSKVIRLLHFALSEDGYLLLGPSESVGRGTSLFAGVSKKWRVYRRAPSRHDLVDVPITHPVIPRLALVGESEPGVLPHVAVGHRLSELAHRVLLAEHAPAAVLVNRRLQVLYFHGPTSDYLEIPSGQPSADLLAMARPGLRARIRAAVDGAGGRGCTVVDEEARMKTDDGYVACRITAKPVRDAAGSGPLFLVIFEQLSGEREKQGGEAPAPRAADLQLLEQLEKELKSTREDLQGSIEELETSNEELKASNEEIMSVNEELQSANEELETSKEELQSMNEELNTVNAELERKLQDIEEVNNDITNLLASTDVATLFLDSQMRIKLFTPHTARLLNLRDTDVGRPISDLSAKVANDDLVADGRKVLRELSPIEKEVCSSEGPEGAWYLRRIVPYKTVDNRIGGVVVTFFDVTERYRYQRALEDAVTQGQEDLRVSRLHYQSVIEGAADGIVSIDGRGTVELFNPAAEKLFGYKAGEVVGRNVKMLMPPPYSDEHDSYIEAYLRTGEAKIIGRGREVEGRRSDGSTFPMRLAVAELVGADPSKFVGTITDLTRTRQMQAELEREHAISDGIVSTAQVVILRLDREGGIVSFNPYMERLCGYALEEVKGKDWFTTFIPEREQERIRELFRRATSGHRTHGNINPILTKDGREVLVEWYDAPLDVPGEPFSLIAIGHDVTARDKLEKEFLQAQKMEAVGRLAGGVAHDFNNLLAGVLSGVRIASRKLDEGHPAQELLGDVRAELERGSSITRRLLDFSRVGKPKRELVDPRETLRASERMLRRLLGEDITVQMRNSPGSPVLADRGQIEQAVLNLAINARDAMPRGGVLRIGCSDVDLSEEEIGRLGVPLNPGSHVVLSIEDTGSGMDAETKRRASEPFFTTKGPGLGTGLGLSSVVTMMDQCGGALALESEVGAGTTVRLFFPRARAGVESPRIASAPADPEGGTERVLLVEDEPLVRLGVKHVLEELGYSVVAVRDPKAALGSLEASGAEFDLLLTDVVLPGMGGPELAEAAVQTHPGIRTLLMSAFPAEELVAQGRIEPGTLTLEKPFSDAEIASKVREALAGGS